MTEKAPARLEKVEAMLSAGWIITRDDGVWRAQDPSDDVHGPFASFSVMINAVRT